MPRQIVTDYTRHPAVITAIGDSYTFNSGVQPGENVLAGQFYGPVLAGLLTAAGTPAVCRLLGISGDTTRVTNFPTIGFLSRLAPALTEPLPKLAIVYGSTNDSGKATDFVPPTNTTDFWSDETLPNLVSIGTQLLDGGIQLLVIPGLHLYNWAVGSAESGVTGAGGTVKPEPDLTAPGSTLGSRLRHAQYTAVTQLVALYPGRVAFCDFYAFMAAHLNANPSQIGVDSYWHVETSDTHLNAVGEALLGDALLATIQAQSGWVDYINA